MDFKKISILIIFAIAVMILLVPANAVKADVDLSSNEKVSGGRITAYLSIYDEFGIYADKPFDSKFVKQRKAEVNKVNKAVVKISGYTPVTFKKPKTGWKITKEGYFGEKKDPRYTLFIGEFYVKGDYKNLKGKSYSVKLYNNNNKLIYYKLKRLNDPWL